MHHCMHAQVHRAQLTKYMSVLVGTASLDWVAINIVLKTLCFPRKLAPTNLPAICIHQQKLLFTIITMLQAARVAQVDSKYGTEANRDKKNSQSKRELQWE